MVISPAGRGPENDCTDEDQRGPTYLPTYLPTVLLFDLRRFFSFFILYTVGRTPWTGDQPVAGPLPTHRTTQTQNERTQTFVP
jgi:hypothetical protein